ncbi:ZnMc domain-containing protein [Mycena venus]|uniref:ZnMc domain-containing protein n=1 Tax=Mycena venus TaxID=2733690 RepID=A0A8H6X964_9AGAR|nr:ZnMc domain-containing protein [Mycena venus]
MSTQSDSANVPTSTAPVPAPPTADESTSNATAPAENTSATPVSTPTTVPYPAATPAVATPAAIASSAATGTSIPNTTQVPSANVSTGPAASPQASTPVVPIPATSPGAAATTPANGNASAPAAPTIGTTSPQASTPVVPVPATSPDGTATTPANGNASAAAAPAIGTASPQASAPVVPVPATSPGAAATTPANGNASAPAALATGTASPQASTPVIPVPATSPGAVGTATTPANGNASAPAAPATGTTPTDTVGLPPANDGTMPKPAINVRPPVAAPTPSPTAAPAPAPNSAANTHGPLKLDANDNTLTSSEPVAAVVTPGTSTLGFNSFPTSEVCIINVPTTDVGPTGSTTSTEALIGAVTAPPNADDIALMIRTRVGLLWDVGTTITYSYAGPSNVMYVGGTEEQQAIVDTVLAEWFPYANIHFERQDNGGMISIAFLDNGATFSGLGNLNGPNLAFPWATLNLSYISSNSVPTDSDRAIILHATGHILGLVHEHRSPANGGSLSVDATPMTNITESLGWDATTCQNQILNVYNNMDLTNYVELDHSSIMRYFGSTPGAITTIGNTTNTGPSFVTPPNFNLSEMDKAFMVLVYPRHRPLNTAPEWTIDRALRVFEVDLATAEILKSAYDSRQYEAGRTAFISFLINKRLGVKVATESQELYETGKEEVVDMEHWKTCAIAILQSEDDEPAVGLMEGSAAHAVITKLTELWDPSSPITYSFLGGTAVQRAKVITVLPKWFYANISLTPVPSNGNIRIAFNPSGGSWSYVGTQALSIPMGQATMNLGWIENTGKVDATTGLATTISANERGSILHEWGHALGMKHEHQSPERAKKLTLDDAAVYAYYGKTQGWDRETIKEQIIDVYDLNEVSNFSALDTKSIMMYFMPPEMNLQRINVPVNNDLSDMDKAYMIINYPGQTTDLTWSLAHALKVAGVDAQTTKSITVAADKQNVTLVRTLFTAFQVEARNKRYADLNPSGADRGIEAGTGQNADSMLQPGWCAVIRPPSTAAPSDVAHGVTGPINLFWAPGETIYFTFLNGQGPGEAATDYRCERVRKVLHFYEEYASITFKERLDLRNFNFEGNPKEQKECPVRIAFSDPRKPEYEMVAGKERKRGGYSLLGASVKNPLKIEGEPGPPWATTWLGDQPLNADTDLTKAQFLRANATLYHELLHVLAFEHEHESPETEVATTPLELGKYLVATMYDPKSIMLYEGLPLVKRIGDTTKQYYEPSETDLALLSVMYPDIVWNGQIFYQALKAFGFNLETPEDEILATIISKALEADTEENLNAAVRTLREEIAIDINNKRRLAKWDPLPAHPPLNKVQNPPQPGKTVKPKLGRGSGALAALGAGGVPGGTVNDAALTVVQNETAPGFLFQLVESLKQFFNPGGNQMFTLQFPGRYLDLDSYAWDTSSAGIYGQFIKPTVVNEAEFRLVDQLYDLQPVVVGPNGTNLSIVYEQVLNNFLPKFVDNGLFEQQDQIRRWLLKDVPMTQWVRDIMERQNAREQVLADSLAGSVNALAITTASASSTATDSTDPMISAGALAAANPTAKKAAAPMFDISSKDINSGETLNRIELSELLMNEYLYAKQDWELERDNMINNATQADVGTPEAQRQLNALTRQLAHITDTRQTQLASKYADAVVRGYSHTVRRYMGYLDIADPAEALQDAKDSLREAAMSSLDGSMSVYPVQMTPLDWFEGLSTSFTMEDLTQDVDLIRTQIDFKSQELDSLNAQLVALQMNSRGDPTALKKSVQDAQDALDEAQSTLALNYTNNVIELARTYLDKEGEVDLEEVSQDTGFAVAALQQLPEQLKKVKDAQDDLTSASRALSTLMAAQALAEATDTKQQQQQLSMRIQSLTGELRELQARWKVLTATTGGVDPRPDLGTDTMTVDLDIKDTLELPPDTTSGGSRWQTLMFTYDSDAVQKMTKQDASASSSQWSCNIWFASASGGSSSSFGEAEAASQATSSSITLAFRATLVTVDRGGWFQPQFFAESQAFYKINPNITWNDGKGHGLLRGYPIGYLIVKDVTIRIIHSASSSDDVKRAEQESSAASGGFLCFSYSQSSSSSSSATASSFSQYNNGYIVKIPGPQILGYMMQKLDVDETTLMPSKLPDDFFIPDDEYNNTVTGGTGQPAAGIDSGRVAHDANPAPAPEPTITPSKMREVLDRLLNEKIGELFGDEKEKIAGEKGGKRRQTQTGTAVGEGSAMAAAQTAHAHPEWTGA